MSPEFTACVAEDLLSDVLAMMHTRGLIHVLLLGPGKQPLGVLSLADPIRVMQLPTRPIDTARSQPAGGHPRTRFSHRLTNPEEQGHELHRRISDTREGR